MYSRRFSSDTRVPPDYSGVAYRAEVEDRKEEPTGEAPEKEETRFCPPRRPLYARPDAPKPPPSPAPPLFSLSGRSFSGEDVILAGLILMLLSDRSAGHTPDGQLLLILGLLLLA